MSALAKTQLLPPQQPMRTIWNSCEAANRWGADRKALTI
jgi:hypothetical protein